MSTAVEPLLASAASAVQAGPLQPHLDEVPIPPIPFPQTVRGIPLSILVSGFFSFLPIGSQVQVNARIFADLSDLQRKIGPLVDTVPLPNDNCAHFSAGNIVARIWGKDLTVAGDVATLGLHGDVDDWACVQNPFGSPFKTRLVNQPFDATLPFRVVVADPHTIAVQLGQPAVNLGGQFGGAVGGILQIAGVNINAIAKEALDRLIAPDLLKQTLPNDLLVLNPVITRAELMSNSGALALYAELTASFDGSVVGRLIRSIFVGS